MRKHKMQMDVWTLAGPVHACFHAQPQKLELLGKGYFDLSQAKQQTQ